MYSNCTKRIIDLILSAMLLLLLAPLLIVTACVIKATSSGSVFYPQLRLGKDGCVFKIVKFRSMINRPDRKPGEAGELVNGNAEITIVGKWIRRLKIDELPQLFSVVKGDMSLIGPRPCLPELANEFDNNGHVRLKIRPGCTGLAQVNGNIHLQWSERWKYDAYYVEHMSFLLDVKILLRTLYLIIVDEKRLVVPFETFNVNNKSNAGRI